MAPRLKIKLFYFICTSRLARLWVGVGEFKISGISCSLTASLGERWWGRLCFWETDRVTNGSHVTIAHWIVIIASRAPKHSDHQYMTLGMLQWPQLRRLIINHRCSALLWRLMVTEQAIISWRLPVYCIIMPNLWLIPNFRWFHLSYILLPGLCLGLKI